MALPRQNAPAEEVIVVLEREGRIRRRGMQGHFASNRSFGYSRLKTERSCVTPL
jgi:hypothetical protein